MSPKREALTLAVRLSRLGSGTLWAGGALEAASAAGREQEQGEEGWQESRFLHGGILRFSRYVTLW